MKVLVTGGTGFIGSALVKRLVEDGHLVRIIDNDERGDIGRLAMIREEVDIVRGDARNTDEVVKAADGVEVIIHLAALNGTKNFYERPRLVLDIGVRSMLSVLEACETAGVGTLVIASSSEVYQRPPVVPTPEDVPLIVPDVMNPRYSYGASKIISEVLVVNYCHDFERAMIFRPHNVYGPDMGWEHVIPQFALRAFDQIQLHPSGRLPFRIRGDGTQTRSFVHIDDLIDGLLLILEKGEHLNVYNIGTEQELQIGEVARQVGDCFGREIQLVGDEAPEGETNRRCPSITKMRKLGFDPRVGFREGLAQTVEWYCDNQHSRPTDRITI